MGLRKRFRITTATDGFFGQQDVSPGIWSAKQFAKGWRQILVLLYESHIVEFSFSFECFDGKAKGVAQDSIRCHTIHNIMSASKSADVLDAVRSEQCGVRDRGEEQCCKGNRWI